MNLPLYQISQFGTKTGKTLALVANTALIGSIMHSTYRVSTNAYVWAKTKIEKRKANQVTAADADLPNLEVKDVHGSVV